MSLNLRGKRVVVFGGSGFIGSHLVNHLCEEACEIKIIFDDGSPLRVMDLIEFDDDFKIKKLTAYNRNFSKT